MCSPEASEAPLTLTAPRVSAKLISFDNYRAAVHICPGFWVPFQECLAAAAAQIINKQHFGFEYNYFLTYTHIAHLTQLSSPQTLNSEHEMYAVCKFNRALHLAHTRTQAT